MTEQDIQDTGDSALKYEEKRGYKRILILFLIGLLTFVLSAGVTYFIYEGYSQYTLNKEHQELIESYGDIEPVNTTVLETDNGYALGVGTEDNYPLSASFIYENDKRSAKKDVVIFLDYSNQRSRDFWFANERFLKGLLESGQIQLTIKPVISSNMYSAFAAEAQAQIMHRHPQKAWETNTSLLTLNEHFQENEELEPEEYVEKINQELNQYHNIDDIDTELLTRGDFTHWIYNVTNDERVQENRNTPLMFIDDSLVSDEFHFDTRMLKDLLVSSPENSQE